MITEHIAYSLFCDGKDCNNYFYGELEKSKSDVIEQAELGDWLIKEQKTYCPDHRPSVEIEE